MRKNIGLSMATMEAWHTELCGEWSVSLTLDHRQTTWSLKHVISMDWYLSQDVLDACLKSLLLHMRIISLAAVIESQSGWLCCVHRFHNTIMCPALALVARTCAPISPKSFSSTKHGSSLPWMPMSEVLSCCHAPYHCCHVVVIIL